ncbi:MaoC/PaaZ C-terminal domain-containing protein [Nocardioides yefusunii]|uniref:MaoC/PaaZ C-terminal domain-containing protein n=1 Tax=Nocardioides yefusunii TaxID=2500546 RepID=A0ABW1QVV1_9ACTN|nr:MaoC/PaaZ C-terminal domain-containing protein [Nocardioides yefusunii]
MAAPDLSGVSRLLRLAAPSIPGVNQLPGVKKVPSTTFEPITLTGAPAAADSRLVAQYAAVCGFPRKDTLPLTFPHLAAFVLHMEIMASPAYAWPAMGGVHTENTITQHRAIALDEVLTTSVTVAAPRPHPKGRVLDFVSTVTSSRDAGNGGDEVVWEEVSTYLVRGRGTEDAASSSLDLGAAPDGTAQWNLPGDLGRRYGRVSGDINPIHLYPVTAKALGFKRQIAHGMWTKARCMAAIENRIPDAVKVSVAFKTPVFLPGTVAFGLEGERIDLRFGLTSPKDGAPHLVGRATAL